MDNDWRLPYFGRRIVSWRDSFGLLPAPERATPSHALQATRAQQAAAAKHWQDEMQAAAAKMRDLRAAASPSPTIAELVERFGREAVIAIRRQVGPQFALPDDDEKGRE